MGDCSKLFFLTTDKENTLDFRIRPTDDQFAQQQKRWNHLKEKLLQKVSESTNLRTSSWLQGSYKFGTQIRPHSANEEFDIDLGVYFEWEGTPNDGDMSPNSLKELVQNELVDYASNTDNDATKTSSPKERCNRIHFTDNFHIDTPVYHLNPKSDTRHLATESNKWESSDPKEIYLWWKENVTEDIRPLSRRIVRYLKMWSCLKFPAQSRPSSILLTVLVAEAFSQINLVKLNGDDEICHSISEAIHQRLVKDKKVLNPADKSENLNRMSEEDYAFFEDALSEFVDTSASALALHSTFAAAMKWSTLFQHFIDVPEPETISTEAIKDAFQLPALNFSPEVNIVARRKTDNLMIKSDKNQMLAVPKGCELTFTLDNYNQLPDGSLVYWTVRNVGTEAAHANDLGHTSKSGFSTKEGTAYSGAHSMDVHITNRGNIIGFKRIPVTVANTSVPPRNPSRRPAYRSLGK